MKKTISDAKESIFKESKAVEGIEVKGPDFDEDVNLKDIIERFKSTGAQASHLTKAIEIIRKMREEKVRIFLGYTSNMVTTGNREIIRYLVKNRLVDVLVTTTGGIEEDFIKTIKPFILGDFRVNGADLRERGINRAGNIFIPNDRYIAFEKFFQPVLSRFLEKQKSSGETATPSEMIDYMGSQIDDESSIYHWAHKNNIPVFCPAFMDGAVGDNVYFFNFDKIGEKKDLKIDMAKDHHKLIELVMGAEETGMILLGGGVMKHTICNANMMREGAKYTVYINTAPEYDGSDSGALPEEAKSWGKIQAGGETVKVFGDATIIFPLIVAGAFVDEK
jgi:deoxyhypusine synthase